MTSPQKRPVPDTPVSNHQIDRARILVVEDQPDVRALLTTALEIEGHHVDGASNAREGLACLQHGHYDLILSDYAMPGETGTWMLYEAERLGLLTDTAALIITAHPDARELRNHDVVPKPLDLDLFLDQVRRIVRENAVRRGGRPMDESAQARRGHRVELVLYVSPESTASLQARRNLESLLERFDMTQIKYTVCDLVRDPLAGDGDRVAFTPTLVKRYPAPRMWVLGTLRDSEIVADVLRVSGVDAKP
jgi:DNA-binding response OmpR family regulator